MISSSSLRLSGGFYAIFSVPFPLSNHFSVMGAIYANIVKRSEAQFRSRQSGPVAPPTPSAPSMSAPFSSSIGMTLEDIMAQLQRMDACLETLSDELCYVNTRAGCIARRQAIMGGFIASPPPSLEADDDDDDATASDDGDASSSSANEMST